VRRPQRILAVAGTSSDQFLVMIWSMHSICSLFTSFDTSSILGLCNCDTFIFSLFYGNIHCSPLYAWILSFFGLRFSRGVPCF
jgi:hypothetical protein